MRSFLQYMQFYFPTVTFIYEESLQKKVVDVIESSIELLAKDLRMYIFKMVISGKNKKLNKSIKKSSASLKINRLLLIVVLFS